MTIQGPSPSHSRYRIQPIDGDWNDDTQDEQKRRRRVLYDGRSWAESEEDLPVHPPKQSVASSIAIEPAKGTCRERVLLEHAHQMFKQLITLEDKIAQLLFYVTGADYCIEEQKRIENLIQVQGIGGLLFTSGSYKRQAYLIEQYQHLSKIPLLMGNDFLHGLSFYGADDEEMTLQRFFDLGKAIVAQNHSLGVHFQFDSQRGYGTKIVMHEEQIRAFRKGIRAAHGLAACENKKGAPPAAVSFISMSTWSESQIYEAMGLRMLHFLDFSESTLDLGALESAFLLAPGAVLLSGNASKAVEVISKAVNQGKISMETLNNCVLKILLPKTALEFVFLNRN